MKSNIETVQIPMKEILTECIVRYGYNEKERLLDIEFDLGYYTYRYINVPKEEVEKLIQEKNGNYFNREFRPHYSFLKKLSEAKDYVKEKEEKVQTASFRLF